MRSLISDLTVGGSVKLRLSELVIPSPTIVHSMVQHSEIGTTLYISKGF